MAGLLQRCEVEGSESVSAEPSEEVEITKRPATKTKGSLKKKEEDADITALGVCKGNDEDEGDNDEGSLGADSDEDGPKKRPSSRKTKHTSDKKDKKEKKEKKHKKSKTGKKRNGNESSLSSETDELEDHKSHRIRVSRECLDRAFQNAALAEQRASMKEAGVPYTDMEIEKNPTTHSLFRNSQLTFRFPAAWRTRTAKPRTQRRGS